MRRYHGELVTAAAIIVLAAYIFWDASSLPASGGLLPMFSTGSIIVLSLYWMTSVTVRRTIALREHIPFDWSYDNMKPMVVLALTLGYVLAIDPVGYFGTTTLYVVVTSVALGMRNWRSIALTLVILLPLMYGFFVMFLGARLPTGLFV